MHCIDDRRSELDSGLPRSVKGSVALVDGKVRQDGLVGLSTRRRVPSPVSSAFVGFRFPAEVIVVAVRWYLRYNLSYRDVEELLLEWGKQRPSLWRSS
jgi:hypothetical protein